MAIPDGYKANLETIIRAAKDDNLSLVECTDKKTGKTVIALCAMSFEDGDYLIAPFAKMFDGNPYDELDPPYLEVEDL